MDIYEAWTLVKMTSVDGSPADDKAVYYEARKVVQKFIDKYMELDKDIEEESKMVESAKLTLVG